MVEEILRLENITYHDEYHQSLHNVWLNVQKHEIVGLLGLNNSGTSTLTRIICGMLPFMQGRFYLGEELLKFSSYRQAKTHGIFYIDSFRQLFDNLDVAENIYLTHKRQKRFFFNRRALLSQTQACLSALDLKISPSQKVFSLSSLQKLSVLLAKALAEHAQLVVIDNLLSTLTENQLEEVYRILNNLSAKGMAIIISEFLPRPLLPICQRIFVLREGRIASVRRTGQMEESLLGTLMVGTEARRESFSFPAFIAETNKVLEVSHVGNSGRLKDLSFCLYRNQVTGILSQDPALEGDILNLLRRADLQQSGIWAHSDIVSSTKRIGLVPETNVIFPNLTLMENITLLAQQELSSPLGVIDRRKIQTVYSELVLTYFGPELKAMRQYPISALDRVMRKMVSICRQLITGPAVLLYINPTRSMDTPSSELILHKIRQLKSSCLSSCILSGDISELLPICQKIYFVWDGATQRVFDLEQDSPDQVLKYYQTHFTGK